MAEWILKNMTLRMLPIKDSLQIEHKWTESEEMDRFPTQMETKRKLQQL